MADFRTPELITPFTQVHRKSAIKSAGQAQLLSGRWAALDASGEAAYPGAGAKQGLYLVIEGSHIHIGSNTEFGGSTPFASTNAESLPSVAAAGAVGLAYGVFRYRVGPEGCNPAATYTVGSLVEVDADGRVIPLAAGVAIARVEAVSTNANGVTELVLRTLGN